MMTRRLPIHWVGPFRDRTGFGKMSREFLVRVGSRVEFPSSAEIEHFWGGPSLHLGDETERRLEAFASRVPDPGALRLAIGSPDHRARDDRIEATHLMTVFECGEVPHSWKEPLGTFRSVIVPSTFNARALRRAGIERVFVVPYGVDGRTPPTKATARIEGDRPFTFGAIADWIPRKGIEDLVLAYTEEFRATEPVRLVLKTSRQFFNPKTRTYWRSPDATARFAVDTILALTGACDLRDLPSIEVLPDVVGDEDLVEILSTWHAYVLTTRGEGWSLTHAQALAAGLPAIATAYGGHLDFMHEGNSFLVPFDMAPAPAEFSGSTWAVCRRRELREALRTVYEDFDVARQRGQRGREEMLARWTWEKAAAELESLLREELVCAASPAGPASSPPATVVVIAHDQFEYTRRCLESLRAHTPPGTEFVLIDNGSSDGTRVLFAEWRSENEGTFPVEAIVNAENQGYPRAANQGIARARGARICLLNNDTVVEPGWLEALLAVLIDTESAGIVCPKVLDAKKGTIHGMGGVIHLPDGTNEYPFADLPDGSPGTTERSEILSAAGPCMLVARRVFESVGVFDEEFSPGYYEDSDLCYRARHAGFRLYVEPASRIKHHGNVTSRAVDRELGGRLAQGIARNQHRFHARWHEDLDLEHRTRISSPGGGVHRIPRAPREVVTVLTPTKNHPDYLARTLRSLRSFCGYPPEYLHLVVADDMSLPEHRARNGEIAVAFGATYLALTTRSSFNAVLEKAAGLIEGEFIVYLEHDWDFFWPADWVTPAVRFLKNFGDIGQVLLKLQEGAWESPEFKDPELREAGDEAWAVLPKNPAPMAPHGYSFQPHVTRKETFLDLLGAATPEFVPRYLEPVMGAAFHTRGLRTAWINGLGFCYHFGVRSAHGMDVELDHLRDEARLEAFQAYMRRGFPAVSAQGPR